MTDKSYGTSAIKRSRGSSEEMEVRAAFLIGYAANHQPVTVRGLYYQAESFHIPGIDKTENGYRKVQYLVLKLRREGRLPYEHISDLTRWMRKPKSYNSIADAAQATARTYPPFVTIR